MKERILKISRKYPSTINFVKEQLTPAIGIRATKEKKVQVSHSKFGGLPDVPKDFKWPFFNGRPLSFIAQINMKELKKNKLPLFFHKKGLLYFFWDTNNVFSKEKFLYPHKIDYQNNENLKEYSFENKIAKPFIFDEARLDFYQYFSLPSGNFILESYYQNGLDMDEHFELLEEIENEVYNREDKQHQILGHPQAIQSDVEYCWAIQYLDFNLCSLSKEKMIMAKNIVEKFELLLQIDFSDENINFSDCGSVDAKLYFGLKKENTKKFEIGKASLIYQNY